MGRFVARRLLQMIPVFIGTTLLIFLMVYSLPGDPIKSLFGPKAADPATVARLRHEYGLDKPLLEQYWNYISGLFQGDFGQSFTGRPVADLMSEAFPVTIRLALLAFGFEVIVGIALGVLTGMRRGKFLDQFVLVLTLIVISIPVFVIGYVTQFLLGLKWKVITPTVQDSENLGQLMIPAIVLAALSLAYVIRLTRTTVGENLRADYIRTAVAKGLPRKRVVGVHLMRNSLIPVVTFLGTDLGLLMGGAIVTEGIFNIQGVGFTLFKAIQTSEGPTVVGIVTVLVLVYLLTSLLVDLLYAVLDPRIRYA
ncbi:MULTISPECIES: ABC transporter permease [Streptomyces]|uniref:ABC transporter permease n=1 Tax=Streptomyces albireticuli TaxID=1940 RepID=A0A1Z2L1B5_9ACTN|nr:MULTISPECIES: ABC transporter permease [Streptomyces]ARZ68102.1 ABC transporter permease [Streptomyces albireticuli]MCD9142611.1 ABC transporter permease [Streptomyces albireticuli]MCD9164010.1 ABC transporter permease [Streptomyces albireticuli]MCD9192739.1 ABC transporter permease [Streptomyces albireticuli]PAU49797.1 ABC transporter permease [Streptomyces albireticuli]